jgi:histidine ammonia-lyase
MRQFAKDIHAVVLDGESLSIDKVVAVARHQAVVSLSPQAGKAIEESRRLVEKIVDEGRVVYGITTGFGDFSKIHIGKEQSAKLQENLILSHCCAVGEPLEIETVRAMMLLRANALAKGHSGIRRELVEALIAMLNKGVHPVVPRQGSLGASGDLAPLAHMALVLLGRGEAYYQGVRMPGKEAMDKAGIATYHLLAKEGLALINGTQCMTAIGALAWHDLNRAAQLADITAGMSLQALTGLASAFDERLHALRPHPGQKLVAKNMRLMLEGTSATKENLALRVQDAYTLRCIPQVHGAVRDALMHAKGVLEIEMNAVTDNPVLFLEDESVISGGNFHGEPIALVMDYLSTAAAELASISERRLERMVNPSLSNGLPPFLASNGGINSGFMICQYSAASLVSENKVFAHPASVDSIPSSANQEDHVSMGTTAAHNLRRIVNNVFSVLAFELMAAVQATDHRKNLEKLSEIQKKVYHLVREKIPFIDEDEEITPHITCMNKLVRSGDIERTALSTLSEFA